MSGTHNTGLESLWRLRKGYERLARLDLQRVSAEIAQTHRQIGDLRRRKLEARRDLAHAIATGVSGGDLATYALEPLDREEHCLHERLKQLQVLQREAEARYLACRRERKITENALERQRAASLAESERREQRLADDATLRRIARSRRSRAGDDRQSDANH